MTARHLLNLGAAAGALAFAAPAMAQAPMPAPPYEYAQPAPPPVVFESDPVIQPVPVPASPYAHSPGYPAQPEPQYEYEYDYQAQAEPMPAHPTNYPRHPAPHSVPAPRVTHHAPAGVAPMAYGHPGGYPGAYPVAYPGAHHPYPPQHMGGAAPRFDRDAWLDDCNDRIRGVDRRERGGVIGGLLGAIGGGIAGNRIADRERLAGTLIGAGVGGLAGLAIGAVIGAAADRDRFDECEYYLDRYLAAYPGPAQAHPGYGYPAYTYTYMPVVVAVPQRAVVREYVTTEWVDVPAAPARPATRTKIVRQPAPTKVMPVRSTKTIKGK